MKRVIITGATGAVGTALIQKMIKNNVEVLVFCREGSERNKHIPEHPLVEKVYCDLSVLSEIQNDTGKEYDIFYHFAWAGTTGTARNDMYLQNQNVKYSLDAVSVAKRFGCTTFIGSGSQAEYGRVNGKLRVNTPTFPENGYGIGKLCAGQMTREYAHSMGIKHIWTRILSIYGPNDGKQSMIMSTINALKEGKSPEFTKGEQLWDYLYSGDAANALFQLGNRGRDGKIYVLGSGKVKPLAEYINIIKNEINPLAEIRLGAIPYDSKQVMHLQADISELQADVGFEPQVNFEEGIRNIVEGLRM